MKALPHDGETAGELVLRSPWLTQGYVDNPEASEALWAGGYLHTGDIAVISPDGYIRITDRIKDVIKSGGEWVSSEQIEDLIEQYPGVKEAAFDYTDQDFGGGVRYPRPHLEIRHPRDDSVRRSFGQNERRQGRQEGSA